MPSYVRKRRISVDRIHGDRRASRRYEMSLSLRWKLIWREKVIETGTGATIDLSSSGISFRAEKALPLKSRVELSIAWPMFLENFPPLQLIVSGVVVRADGGQNAIRMNGYEFRTVAAAAQRDIGKPTIGSKVVSIAVQ